MVVWTFGNQIIVMIFENFVDWFGRSPVDRQARAVLASYALIWAIQHNEMYRPWTAVFHRGDQHPFASAASIYFSCFKNHSIPPLNLSRVARPSTCTVIPDGQARF